MKRYLEPLNDRVLVKRAEAAKKSPGGIYIPDDSVEKPCEGTVVAVGPGSHNGQAPSASLEEGQTVLFGKYSGTDVTFDHEEYVLLRFDELFAVVREEAEPPDR